MSESAYDKLNDQQKVFVNAVMDYATSPATVRIAAEKAGYEYDYARHLVTKDHIQDALNELREQLEKSIFYSRAHLMRDLLSVKERSLQQVQVKDSQGAPTGEYKFDSSGANSALDKLGKMMGAYTNKVEHSGDVKGIVGIQVVYSEDIEEEEE